MPEKITLRDIADAAGVSIFTVSKALNGGGGVSDKNREHVLNVAGSLGYVPNLVAQELRGAVRSSIAVITAGTANAYYLDMMNGIQHVMQAANQAVVLMDITADGAYNPALEDRTIQRLLEARMGGVITTLTLKPESIDRLSQWDIPVVFVDSSPPDGFQHLPSVTTDNHAASLQVGDHLAKHGFEDWLFLAYPEVWSSRRDREAGLRRAAELAGAMIEVVESANDSAAARQIMSNTLDERGRRPDVVIAGNNPLLLGVLGALRDRDLHVPDDVAVVSYDDFSWAPFTRPAITVLDERSEEIGTLAAQTLMQIIGEQAGDGSSKLRAAPNYRDEFKKRVPVGLIVRRSCGCNSADDGMG